MPDEMEVGCARPTGGPVGESDVEPVQQQSQPAYHNGRFVSVKLSEYLGKWVLLCFYPGDFTFV
jgi:hypothetical protein